MVGQGSGHADWRRWCGHSFSLLSWEKERASPAQDYADRLQIKQAHYARERLAIPHNHGLHIM
jgi:hypothetical protein